MYEPAMHIAKWKKPICKEYGMYDSNSMTFWKGKTMDTVKGSVIAKGSGGESEGRMNR